MSKIILASVVMYLGLFVFKMFVQLKPMLNVAVDGLVGAIIYIVLIIVLRVVDMKDLKQQLMKNLGEKYVRLSYLRCWNV